MITPLTPSFASVRIAALLLVASCALLPAQLAAQNAATRNGKFQMEWMPDATDGPVRMSGHAKGNLRIESRGDSAQVRLEVTQRPDGQSVSNVHELVGSWRGDTLTFIQPMSSQVQANGQAMAMSGHSAWRLVVAGDAISGSMQPRLDQMDIAIPSLKVTGKRTSP